MKDFGWQGIHLQIPEDWELDAHNGNFDSGYASLDDGKQVRLQLRWIASGQARLEANVRKYRRSLERASKGSLQFDTKPPSFLKSASSDALEFAWQSPHQSARGLAYYCPGSKRIMLLEVLSTDEPLVEEIFRSATKTRPDTYALWSVYDFPFLVPADYRLIRSDLMPGILRFFFRKSRRDWLNVYRWALASHMLEKVPLERWPRELFKLMGMSSDGFEQRTAAIEPVLVRGADCQSACSGRRTDSPPHAGYEFEKTHKRLLTQTHIAGIVWPCLTDDRLFAVIAGGNAAREVSQQVASSIKCSP